MAGFSTALGGVTKGAGALVGLGDTSVGGGSAFWNCSSNADERFFAFWPYRMESESVRTKKMPVAYFVILVSALPLPAPNSASVVPPPKAVPMPASFLGNCTSTSKMRSRQFTTSTKVKK